MSRSRAVFTWTAWPAVSRFPCLSRAQTSVREHKYTDGAENGGISARPLPNLSPRLSVTYTVTPRARTRRQWRALWVRVMPTAHGSVWRHKHRCDANYAKGRPRCFVAREPKLSTRFSLSLAFLRPSNGAEEDRPSVSNCTEISDNFTHCRLASPVPSTLARIINARRLFRHLRRFRFERDKKKRAHAVVE